MPGFDDAGLFPGDVLPGGPEQLGVVEGDVGDDGDGPVGDVGGVPAPAHADLDDRDVNRAIGEIPESGGGEQLEPGRPHLVAEEVLQTGQIGENFGEIRVANRLEADHNALVQALQVGANESTDVQPFGNEQLGHGTCR